MRLRQLDAGRVDRDILLERVGFFIGERLARDAGGAGALRAHAPIHLDLAAAGDVDVFRGAIDGVEAGGIERDARLLGGGQVVVDDGGDDHFIALHEEPRHDQADNQVLAHDGLERGAADFGGGRGPACGGAPGGQRIGKLHFGLGVTVGVGDDARRPRTRYRGKLCGSSVGPGGRVSVGPGASRGGSRRGACCACRLRR